MDRYEIMYRDVLSGDDTLCSIKYKNVTLHSGGVCNHPDCKKSVYSCDTCYKIVCPTLRCTKVYAKFHALAEHHICEDCGVKVTCRANQMCMECANRHRYDMITENLAVGGYSATYQPFDIIVNVDYPENNARYHEITIRSVRKNPSIRDDPSTEPKPMILCGFYDSEYEFNPIVVHKILRCIAEQSKKIIVEKRHFPKILIHCTAGISRSSTIAIAYLAQLLCISNQEAYYLVKSKRRIIRPNEGFRILLGITL